MTKTGYDAYKQTHKNGLKGRALEGESFMKAVQLLKQAQEFDGNRRLLMEALDYTRKLWTIVQADLKEPNHHLSEDIRTNLLSLSLYVDRTCYDVAKKPHPQKLQGLIDVNYQIATGLLGTG
ncbi:flagellar biosynthesis regulator FlaF [Terasakiella sp.]|uniref:flagellar biosynthesis regulator FlaF n=1 Tax=Terasakiella sp. TaxID=2034861 RepID=UPI003AA95092